MPPRRQQDLPVESSWRLVEGGENDSFDTSILPDLEEDEGFISTDPSQIPSQSFSIGGSQESHHSVQDFMNKADDERVILRSPFQPTIRRDPNRSPDPEFVMPSMRFGATPGSSTSPRQSSGRSTRTIRPGDDPYQQQEVRRRVIRQASTGSPLKLRRGDHGRGRDYYDDAAEEHRTVTERLSESLPGAIFNVLAWVFNVIGMALGYVQKPLALCLAVWLFFGASIMLQNMVTKSLTASLSPFCRIPGAAYLDLPFCPSFTSTTGGGQDSGPANVEFDDLMNVQSQFEQVLERSADGVSLPMEMKRSESSIRDLRTMVRYSELPQRDELVYEFNEYIDTARLTAADLQKFNVHVGSAVDSVISINRWTSRYLDTLSASETTDVGILSQWSSWIFYPFTPTVTPFSERTLLDKYVEHTAMVSDRISSLIVEAQGVLLLLTKAEEHLNQIYELVTRSSNSVKSRRDEVLWTLWTLVGANNKRLHNLNAQLSLLRQVDRQRSTAVAQLSALIVDLEKIQAGLGDLRDRVAAPELLRDSVAAIPLSVHIETIDRGVERLEDARQRIRANENDKIREALARGGTKEDDKLIDGRS
ncbi:hypothetical protein CH63R_05781 [Colletotrichum higginsianum IMI 349063]|uniref:Uncharacterized protein n=3 Tax=Colletotrichum higginsianum TaxID=80884 RepID=A0A1B7YDH7_COLHI|nr:hypothetical protein CH63R_05781 [Colletotrichum higginsianum IMI 349063]OBR10089.1 hypothetical protein CH63R_05781 [Colletotrichum higginsianum IMI 349063]TID07144.1 hypothetical protein CH35J_001349 [Colletotrichum higginsianum]GJD02891.1 hypothetical protein ColKHC_11716 [Colletotrichum higginsianum]